MATEKSGEYRGKSVEAAVSIGLAALGVPREAVDVEVIRPGSRGLLGIGAEDAVVRLTVIGAGAAPRPTSQAEAQPQAPAPAARPESTPARSEGKPPRQSDGGQRARQERREEPSVKQQRDRQTQGEPRAESAPDDEESDISAPEATERAREYLAGLLQRMNLKADVQIVEQAEAETSGERGLVLNIVGDDLGILIGRQSEVLTALQFVTRLMVNQQTKSRSNVVIDVNGYKAKRAESLRKLALRTAEQVEQTGRVMALEPMPPAERRIIHLALRNHPAVASQSVGEGNRRKVTVVPKK